MRKLVALGGLVKVLPSGKRVGRMVVRAGVHNRRKAMWQFQINEATGCWEWARYKTSKGYGITYLGGQILAHRLSWKILGSKNINNYFVLHRCDNPGCINPCHLFLGTQKDNVRDCITKGRRSKIGARGEKNAKSKLKINQVKLIREWNGSHAEAGRTFKITRQSVWAIKHRKTWRHL